MHRIIVTFILSIIFLPLQAQEFKADVTINAAGVRGSNKQVFRTLEKAIEEFINKRRWTDKQFQNHEKIKVDILLNIKEYDINNNKITAELYFRSYRPVFKSDYETLLLNLVDKNFEFTYREFEKLDFNIELFDNNLVSTLAFYAYVALGHDFDSFKENAGKPFYEKAEIIQTNAEQNGVKGWAKDNKNNSKGDLIEQLLNEHSNFYHKAVYTYHRWGLDMMADNLKLGKNNIITAINYLKKLREENHNADYLIKIFFDAKADEIVQIFSAGPPVNTAFVVNKLRNLAPNYDFKWDEIMTKGNTRERGFGGPPRMPQNIKSDRERSRMPQQKEGDMPFKR